MMDARVKDYDPSTSGSSSSSGHFFEHLNNYQLFSGRSSGSIII
jgi:hypothetical protein